MTVIEIETKIDKLIQELSAIFNWIVAASGDEIDSPEYRTKKRAYDEKKAKIKELEDELLKTNN